MTNSPAIRAQALRALARLNDSIDLVSRLRSEFHGDGDPLSLLWWRANPLQPTVDGTPDPALALRALRRRVYSREGSLSALINDANDETGTHSVIRAAEQALHSAELALARNERALDSALSAALSSSPSSSLSSSLPSALGAILPAPSTDQSNSTQQPQLKQHPDDSVRPAESSSSRPLHRNRWIIAAALVTVSIAGFGIVRESTAVGRGSAGAAGISAPSANPSATRPPDFPAYGAHDPTSYPYQEGTHFTRETSDIGNPDLPLALFEVAQQPSDISPIDLGSNIVVSSERALFPVAGIDARPYAARTVTGAVCLSIVLPNDLSGMTCVSQARFVSDGIQLRLSTTLMVNFPHGTAAFQRVYYQFDWAKDGSLSGASNL